jgi:plasmid stabilization system protein ParE
MPQLIWSPHALLDVQRLYQFFAPKNQDAHNEIILAVRHQKEASL